MNLGTKFKIESIRQLELLLGQDMVDEIIVTAICGDPDWLCDIVSELDYIKPESPYFIKGFHDVVLKRGFKSDDFDCDSILNEITFRSNPWGFDSSLYTKVDQRLAELNNQI